MQNIYCGNTNANNGQGHFLARVSGANLEIWCPQCKVYHAVAVVDIVRGTITALQQNGHEPEQDRRLMW